VAVATAQTVAEAIPHRARDAARLIRVALNSPAAGRARRARRVLREVPFAFKDASSSPTVVVEGFVDLVIEYEDGIEIVDWKTDDIPEAAIGERLQRYQTQAGLYVLGLQNAIGRPVTRISYVFVSAGQEASPGEPADLATAALGRLRSL
jgi:ATP-dependent exoDNAse (exonuclease V) beta subunit